jgi:glycosyltransferase involved in cell wall biosynthesis
MSALPASICLPLALPSLTSAHLVQASLQRGVGTSCASSLSVIIPFLNEAATLPLVIARLAAAGLPEHTDIIGVDDGSSDHSAEIFKHACDQHGLLCQVISHPKNLGKGAAVCTGLKHAAGDICVIQDADLEYNPRDIPSLIAPIIEGDADVAFGSRFLQGGGMRFVPPYKSKLVNSMLTVLSNLVTNLDLTDMETGYKAFRRECLIGISLKEPGFGMEPELTVKFARRHLRIVEVPISYAPRTVEDGKKIRWTDGVRALYCLVKYRFVRS